MRKFVSIILAAVILMLAMASCKKKANEPVAEPDDGPQAAMPIAPPKPPTPKPPPQEKDPPEPTPEWQDVTAPPELVEELLGLWSRIDGSTATIPLTEALHSAAGRGGSPPQHNTTSMAYFNLISKYDTDLIFVTYPSEDELEMAREQGVELEVIPVVKDALVFLVNAENPVDSISLEQLRNLYSGRIKNWEILGGTDEPVIPYQRTQNSGSQTLLIKLVMNGGAPMAPPTEWVVESMGALVEVVSDYDNAQNAIGYSMFYFVNNMYGNSRFKLLGVEGVKPSRYTIMSGEYPLEDCYYAVIRKDTPDDHPARKLIDWVLSEDGQTLAVQAGYIPLSVMSNLWPIDMIDPIYLGDTENSSGTGGKALKTSVDDAQPRNGVRRPLSDMFFSGFNYIQYINNEIIRQFAWIDTEEMYSVTLGEQIQTRPFTGIPNDYPNYEINGIGYLIIDFPEDNPFFNRVRSFYIPLTEDISPYGEGLPDFTFTYEFVGRKIPRVNLFSVRVGIRDNPDAAARINERLRTWTNSIPGAGESVKMLNSFIEWYMGSFFGDPGDQSRTYNLQPSTGRWRDYLTVSYVLQTYDGPSYNMPMVSTICFRVDTGNVANLASVLPDDLDYSQATILTLMDFGDLEDWGYPRQVSMTNGYVPAAGSVITDAWIMEETIYLYLTEPDGRILQVAFWEPME